MKINKNLPNNFNHRIAKERISQRFGIEVDGFNVTYDDERKPKSIEVVTSLELPVEAVEEITREPEKAEQEEVEERQFQQGPFKKIMARIEALEAEISELKGGRIK